MMSFGRDDKQKNSIVSNHPTLNQIDEIGLSEMECDSMHSKIKVKAKCAPMYSAEDWMQEQGHDFL